MYEFESGHCGKCNWQGKRTFLGKKPVPVPLLIEVKGREILYWLSKKNLETTSWKRSEWYCAPEDLRKVNAWS